ncbi:MAG: hypothetical protein DSM106950_01915 [Stigonema ocellatum SAG 48.90 = DSM 106950]|nr:hypothetical protein [Stigonema ocellatum SAG 48.90 = DSM 106950]
MIVIILTEQYWQPWDTPVWMQARGEAKNPPDKALGSVSPFGFVKS